jgi:hypothetical protein
MRTPLTTARRVGIPNLPKGKTPLHNSTMKTRAQQKQIQTTKRINMDVTPSPIKQRRLVDQIINTTENTSTYSLGGNITTGLKSSMIVRLI